MTLCALLAAVGVAGLGGEVLCGAGDAAVCRPRGWVGIGHSDWHCSFADASCAVLVSVVFFRALHGRYLAMVRDGTTFNIRSTLRFAFLARNLSDRLSWRLVGCRAQRVCGRALDRAAAADEGQTPHQPPAPQVRHSLSASCAELVLILRGGLCRLLGLRFGEISTFDEAARSAPCMAARARAF